MIGTLREAGFPIEMSAHAFSVMDGNIYGFAQQQQNLAYDASQEAAQVAQNILQQIPADEYPHLAELIIKHAMKPDYDYAKEFEFGLDLILNGLEETQRKPRN